MATGIDVLTMLCPAGGWIISDNNFDTIVWVDERPRCTKEQFEAGFTQYDAWKAQQDADKAAAKAALLARLGITQEEAQLLLGGN
jgi:hypothetical protein